MRPVKYKSMGDVQRVGRRLAERLGELLTLEELEDLLDVVKANVVNQDFEMDLEDVLNARANPSSITRPSPGVISIQVESPDSDE